MPSNHLILCCPLLLQPSIFPSIRVSSSHQVPKVLELQFQHQSFQWIFRLISFRINWFDLLAVQGILKSLLQCHSSKASILQHSASYCPQPPLINQRCSGTPGCPAPRYPFPVEINQTWPYLGGHPWLSGKRAPPKEATAIWAYKWVRLSACQGYSRESDWVSKDEQELA